MKSQVLPCTPACDYKFNAFAVYLPAPHIYSTFPIGGTFGIQLNICNGTFLQK